jgi:hypothetical protein
MEKTMRPSRFRCLFLTLLLILSACGGGGNTPPPTPVPIQDSDHDGVADDRDAAPNDALCSAEADASGGVCFLRTLASSRLRLVGNAPGKIFLLAEGDALQLYGYDLVSGHFTGRATVTGYTPVTFAYVPDHGRLYAGDSEGKIHCYSEALQECAAVFAKLPLRVAGLAAAGKYLVAQDASGAWATHYIFDQQGRLTDQKDWNYFSSTYEWSPADSRLYFFRDSQSPNDLMYEVIDQANGRISAAGETPYHGDYSIEGPIRVNAAGNRVLLGSGDIYEAPGLTWNGNLWGRLVDASWLANGDVVTLSRSGNNTILSRYSADRTRVEELPITAQVLGIASAGTNRYVVLQYPDRIAISPYVPSDDSDGDGVPNVADKFPLDKTAAVDSDNDGYPDAFLGNYTAGDSPTKLTLDAYPFDASCHAPEQGDGVSCSSATTNVAYVPDQILSDGRGTVYLLSKKDKRVYRWSAEKGAYLPPLVIGKITDADLTTMAYSAAHNRLYFGYANGMITYASLIDDSRETPFFAAAARVRGVAAAGSYLLAQDDSGAWATHYILDKQGRITDHKDWNYYSGYYEWNPSQARIYFFRDDTSPNDLQFEQIDQSTGKISAAGESPYHGDYAIAGPIRVSLGGGRVLLGSGNIYSTLDLTVVKSLGAAHMDAQWRSDGSLVTLAANGSGNATVTVYDASLVKTSTQTLPGQAKALLPVPNALVAVMQSGDRPQFITLKP